MDFKTQNNQQPQASPTVTPRPVGQGNSKGPGFGRKLIAGVIALVVALLLVAGLLLLWQTQSNDKTESASVEKDKYQALFLTNGQVYFGHLSNLDENYTELTDVYYLQVQQSVQPSTSAPAKDAKAAEQPQVSLTKLGNELHGPTDKMHISRDQVLFWENLKNDSTVVKAISDYKAKL